MNSKILRHYGFIPIIVIFLSSLVGTQQFIIPVQASGETPIFIDPLTQPVSLGSLFTVDVSCIPTKPIKAFEFTITFNPSLVRVNSVSEGDIFDGYSTFFYNGTIDNIGGTVENIYGLILGLGSVSSSGTFVTVSFTAKSTAGTSPLKLINVGITNNTGYIPIVVSNGSVQIIQANQPPVLTGISPTNGSFNIPLTKDTVSITIRDPDGDYFNYTIQTRPNIGSASVRNALNGTKSCVITGLSYGTTYRWYVNATDGTHWIRRWYIFTTANAQGNTPVVFSGMNPSNGSTNVPVSTSSVSLLIKDPGGKSFDYTIQTRPDVGDVSVHAAQNGTKQCIISGLAYATTYRWFVNATGGVTWQRQWYIFTTAPENPSDTDFPYNGGNNDTSPDDNESPSVPTQNNPPDPPSQPLGPTAIQRGITYAYTSTAFDANDDTVQLRFNWGDGTYSEWTALITSNVTVTSYHAWYNISSYAISVIARDEKGNYSNWSVPLTVTVSQAEGDDEPPTFTITTTNISVNHTCQFHVSGLLTENGDNTTYYWEFGDGTTATGKTQTHIFQNPGSYTVSLTITDSTGKTYKKSITVIVPAYTHNASEKQEFVLPYLYIPFIGLIIVILFIGIKFFKKRTKTYSSKKPVNQQPRVIHNAPAKIITIISPPQPRPFTQNIIPQKPKSTSPSFNYINTDLEKNVDDILLDKMHEIIDKL